MANEILTFDEGNPAVLTMQFTNPSNGATVQPATVLFHWKPLGVIPAASATTWTAGVDPQIDVSQQANGTYTATLPLSVTNGRKQQTYECRWESLGTWPSSHPFVIIVTAKNL